MLKPISRSNWNSGTAAHLASRAGFGATPPEILALVEKGPEQAVDRFLNFHSSSDDPLPDPEWSKPDPGRFERYQAARNASPQMKQSLRREEQKKQREHVQELRFWWLRRMAEGSNPLQEKLTLFWHGHFATSAQKVKNAYFMWRQNDLFRRFGAGNWLALLTEVSKDPAMLIWLDQAQSRREHPNENFAREVMELFTLGEGNYTEQDITEAARAFTGWSLDRLNGEFIFRTAAHDPGEKVIFGRKGQFFGDHVLRMIVARPEADQFIARKLWIYFAGDEPADELIEALARSFRGSGRNFRPLLRQMFLSEEFYAADCQRQQVKSPVQWLISSVRLLQRDLPPGQICSNALKQIGQDLLLPPNVKGWDGGLSWINTSNLINRYNFASFLIFGESPLDLPKVKGARRARMVQSGPVDVARLFPEDIRRDKKKLLAALELCFIQGELRSEHRSSLRAYLEAQGDLDDVDVLHAIRLIMCTPEYQLA